MARIPRLSEEEHRAIARDIEDGTYFRQARAWYRVFYMALIPQRSLYTLVTAMASLCALLAILAIFHLLPLAPLRPVLLPMQDITRNEPRLYRLKSDPLTSNNKALIRYLVAEYTQRRENYSYDRIQAQYRFVSDHSSPQELRAYRKYINPRSKRSPVNRYQRLKQRRIALTSMRVERQDGEKVDWDVPASYIAEVGFRAEILGDEEVETSRWKARMTFDYKPLKVKTKPEAGEDGSQLHVDSMAFVVTDYNALEQLRP